jgi:hypothetical protein
MAALERHPYEAQSHVGQKRWNPRAVDGGRRVERRNHTCSGVADRSAQATSACLRMSMGPEQSTPRKVTWAACKDA